MTPVQIGRIVITRYNKTLRRFYGRCVCGNDISLSQFEYRHKLIQECYECRRTRELTNCRHMALLSSVS